ncbi:MAG: hypothetical protein HRF42_09355 [Candidatus Brocadia sp.]|jgi:hypothetical protein
MAVHHDTSFHESIEAEAGVSHVLIRISSMTLCLNLVIINYFAEHAI